MNERLETGISGMTDSLALACLKAAKARGDEYAVLYYKADEPTLSFIEGYTTFEDVRYGKKKWQKLGYSRGHTYALDYWEA